MMRLGSVKDVKTLFSHFVAALAFRCIFINTGCGSAVPKM